MISLRNILEKERRRLNVSWSVLEQDYLLSWLLWGMQTVPDLKNNLVFKGGTALKKAYFGDYRFSEDLDFTLVKNDKKLDFSQLINLACETVQTHMNDYFPNPVVTCAEYKEKKPHPDGQEAYTIRAQFPWHREPQVRVMVEITKNELLVMDPIERFIQFSLSPSKSLDFSLMVYPLEEIMAEKLRAILQNIKKYHEQGWGRSRARDYYDLWCILQKYLETLKLEIIPNILEKKCSFKNLPYPNSKDFFEPLILEKVKIEWQQWLAPLVPDLPPYEIVLKDLEKNLKEIVI